MTRAGQDGDPEESQAKKDADEGSRKGEDTGSLHVASRDSRNRDFEMRMGGIQKPSVKGEVDEQSVAMAGLSVKFADHAGNGVARRGAMLVVGGAAADLLAVSGKDPIGCENGLEGAAGW